MASPQPPTDEAIRAAVARLARRHRSGGFVIERAAILAEGERSADIVDWILRHAGEAEVVETAAPPRGLYGAGFGGSAPTRRGPARYLLPASALAPARDEDVTD
jgi:hypothetical protein